MKRKTGALLLAGMIMATVAVVMAWDMTDSHRDIGSNRYIEADATVVANFNEYMRVTAFDRDAYGRWYSSHPSGWTKEVYRHYGGGVGSTFVSAACNAWAIDQNGDSRDYASTSARVP